MSALDDSTQTPFVEPSSITTGFANVEFAENPEPRCPCLLLLDTSASMAGEPIAQLNLGLQSFKDELAADSLAAKRVEVAVLTFGGNAPHLAADFTDAGTFVPPHLAASGATPMGAAIRDGLARLNARKESYRTNGVAYYRPWVFLITDGEPTDEYQSAASAVREGEARGSFSFYAVAVKGANVGKLGEVAPLHRPPVMLDGLRFRDLFQWLSKSMRTVSQSRMGTTVQLDAPGWTTAIT
jgi:uncharacterized protein YegL